jgi:DNA invertase Pin-like site-specific DNA recombinase
VQKRCNLFGRCSAIPVPLRNQKIIAKAKEAGVYKGRPPSIDAARVRELKVQGLGATEIAKALKIGRASVYRALEAG